MSRTANLGLPLVQAAQAQKHVTVNEGLVRLDGLAQLTLESRSAATPPAAVTDGAAYAVPAGAVNAWAGQDGAVAIGTNGGWDFVRPKAGWRAFVKDEGQTALHDGADWRGGGLTRTDTGAGLSLRVVQFDQVLLPGPQTVTPPVIPADAMLFGVTGRVVATLTGTHSAWALGNPGAAGRFGTGLGNGAGSFVRGIPGQPLAYYAATPLQIDATGGSFAGGTIRLALHFVELSIPEA